MKKNFEWGLVLGRFHHLHKGHMEIIDVARSLCEKTLILIGSSQESRTIRNPYDWQLRQRVIQKVYNQPDVVLGTLEDMTNEEDICFEWGKYILENVETKYHLKPDLMVYGKDESRKGWFSEEDSQSFSEMIVARNKIEISATQLRQYLVQNEKEKWKQYTPEAIWDMYEELREELLKIE